jgi:NAD(P)-dependent dehydrogenase (short-subunit alcohol dehydrogenase family)
MASNVALMGVAGLDCYTAAKGGIAAIARSMAVEFAPQKVRVSAIAPAATMTIVCAEGSKQAIRE